jgi:hypothetical protein
VEIPNHLHEYACADYFSSPWSTQGCWDETSQMWVIVSAAEVEERQEIRFLVVGRPGVDGIEFGYRQGRAGLWAYYPIEGEFVLMAPTVAELVEGWLSGKLSV